MKRTLFIVIFLFMSTSSLCVVSDQGFDPLDQSGGARPLGMGGAFTAMSYDLNSQYYNPAGMADSKGLTATFRGVKNFSLGAGYDTGIGNIGIGLVNKEYDGFDTSLTKSNYTQSLALLSYGIRFDRLSLGVSVKSLLFQRLSLSGASDVSTSSGYNMDMGLIWRPLDYMSLGALMHNMLDQEYRIGQTDEAFPMSTRIGVAVNILGDESIFSNDTFGLLIAYDSDSGTMGDNKSFSNSYYGIEGSYGGWLFIRLGGGSVYAINENVNMSTFGIGYKVRDTRFDFASVNDPFTGASASYISLVYSPPEFAIMKKPGKPAERKEEKKPEKPGAEILLVTSPQDDFTSYDETIAIEGQTDPKASVLINGVNVFIGDDGKFKAVQTLNLGKNLIEIQAALGGEKRTVSRKVLRKAKVIIAEEEGLNKKIVEEVLNKEDQLAKIEQAIKKDKEKGIDVTEREKAFKEEKQKYEITKTGLYSEKKKLEERKGKVENLVTLGVIEVSPEKAFEIEAPIRKGEMISWLVKASGMPIPKVDKPVFDDVLPDNPYAPHIKAALDAGIIKTTPDNKFRPNEVVTEEEAQIYFKAFGVIK